jgi:hypothetical protein
VVDGVEIAAYPQKLLAAGKVAPGVPMLLGSNRDEGSLFREQTDFLGDEAMFDAWLNATVGPALADEARARGIYTPATASAGLYEGGNGSVWSTLQSDFIGDQALHCPARRAAAALEAGAGAFLYSFEVTPYFTVNWPPELWLGGIGAFHGAEVPFALFDTFELTGSEVELGAQMATFWTNFAKTGDPNLAFPADDGGALDDGALEAAAARRLQQGAVAAAAADALPAQGAPYLGRGAESARVNGTVQQSLRLGSVGACCAACAHVFYASLCNGWRWHQPSGRCELLSGAVTLANPALRYKSL